MCSRSCRKNEGGSRTLATNSRTIASSTSAGSSVGSIACQCTLIAALLLVQRFDEESRRAEVVVLEAETPVEAARPCVVVLDLERQLAAASAPRVLLHGPEQRRSDASPLVLRQDRQIVNV